MINKQEGNDLRTSVIKALKEIYDPELPVNIYELGLIYQIDIDEKSGKIKILMTLTTPNCPVADTLPEEIRHTVKSLTGAKEVEVKLTFDPPYDISRLSEEAKLALGML